MSEKIDANKIRKGNIIKLHNKIGVVHDVYSVKPGKGGAYVQLDMKELITGASFKDRIASSEMVDKPMIDEVIYVYLYEDGPSIVLMEQSNCDQVSFDAALCPGKPYLCDGMEVTVVFCESNPIEIKVPDVVECVVAETEAVIKGQTASASFKPALLKNGLRISVPTFVQEEDKILVKTADNSYYKRAS